MIVSLLKNISRDDTQIENIIEVNTSQYDIQSISSTISNPILNNHIIKSDDHNVNYV